MKTNKRTYWIAPTLHPLLFREDQWIYSSDARQRPDYHEGEIVEVPFPYSDLSGFKSRPALILAVSKSDLIVAFFSTHLSWASYEDIILLPDEKNGLHSASLLRVGKLFTIHSGIVYRKIGNIGNDDMEAVRWCVSSFFSGHTFP